MVWFGLDLVDSKLVWGGLAGYAINVTGWGHYWKNAYSSAAVSTSYGFGRY